MTDSGGGRPKVSAVLPCRDGAATLPTQLEALARQSWDESWELIVSDNGSTDDSVAVVERYRDRLPALRIVDSSDKPGIAHALNIGVAAAMGESVVFVNDDDEVGEGWLAAMGEALKEGECVAGRLDVHKLNEPWAVEARALVQTDGLLEWGFEEYLPFAAGATIGVRRELHDSIGGFDETFGPAAEDLDYCWRLQLAGARFGFVPDAVVHYRMRHSLGDLFRQALAYGEGHALVYKKYQDRGLPRRRRPWRRAMRGWAGLGRRLLLVRDRATLAAFVWQLGLRVGLARGSLRHRVLFP